MSNSLPPIALSPAALSALQARAAAAKPPAPSEPDVPAKPMSASADTAVRRGQYVDIVV